MPTVRFAACAGSIIVCLAAATCKSATAPTPTPVTLYGGCDRSPNYLSAVGLQRWEKFPIAVSINVPASVPAPWREHYRTAYQTGVQLWALRLGDGTGAVSVSFDNPAAEIQVNQLTQGACFCTVPTKGPARSDRDPLLVGARIDLGRQTGAEFLGTLDFFQAYMAYGLAHEMGHAFGIVGHSQVFGDLMAGPPAVATIPIDASDPATLANPLGWITESDRNTLWQAYCR